MSKRSPQKNHMEDNETGEGQKVSRRGQSVRPPYSMKPRQIRGNGWTANARKTRWEAARRVRSQLQPIRTLREVGKMVGCSHANIELIELKALTKIIEAFKDEQ